MDGVPGSPSARPPTFIVPPASEAMKGREDIVGRETWRRNDSTRRERETRRQNTTWRGITRRKLPVCTYVAESNSLPHHALLAINLPACLRSFSPPPPAKSRHDAEGRRCPNLMCTLPSSFLVTFCCYRY